MTQPDWQTVEDYMTEQGQEGRDACLEKRKPEFRKYPWLAW